MKASRRKIIGSFVLFSLVGTATGAVSLPKEGPFNTHYCFSGTGQPIALNDNAVAGSYTLFATVQSTSPGGAFDQTASHCMGLFETVNGKTMENGYCDVVDADGDKYLLRYLGDSNGGKVEAIAGTGKYEGMTLQGEYRHGGLPTTSSDRFYACNRFSGTYKLR
jgi:hypothetical protein